MVPPITLLPEERIPEQAEPLGPGQLLDQGQKPFPLRALAVRAHLTGPLASVEVSQRFANPHAEPIEAVYIFPLPSGASVYRFRMKVADRVVEGEVQERQRARQTYDEGLKAGHRAALLEQERDNVFTVTLGNLPPGEEVTIEMAYAGRMEVHETETTFRFPLVVAPRYIPGEPVDGGSVGRGTSPDTDQVPDASRLTPPLLLPGLTTGASLDISVRLECAGLPPSRLACSQHVVSQRTEGGDLVIELARGDELLNRDFVLRYQTGGEQPQALLLADEGHFLLQVLPPRQAPAAAFKRDLVFVLDRSGSMSGAKIASAQAALVRFLRRLGPDDRFAILAFDNSVESYRGGKMCGVSEVEEACRWVQRVGARGGTEILEPIRQVLNRRLEEGRLTAAVVLTDGQVGNEPAIYKMVAEARSPVRLFTLGLDTAVNDAFLRRLAQLGRGTCELVTPGEKLEAALERLERETHSPLVTDLELVDCGLGFVPDSLVPERLPDLFAARPVTVVGRKTGPGGVLVRGRLGPGETWTRQVAAQPSTNPALGLVWAREQVTALEDRLRLAIRQDRQKVEQEILDLALRYKILTRFTAFVLVDRSQVVSPGGEVRTVVQPVELPAQWDASFAGAPAPAMAPPQGAMMRMSLAGDLSPGYAEMGLLSFLQGGVSSLKRGRARPRPAREEAPPSAPPSSDELPELVKRVEKALEAPGPLEEHLEKLLAHLEKRGDLAELVEEGRRLLASLGRRQGEVLERLTKWLEKVKEATGLARTTWWKDFG